MSNVHTRSNIFWDEEKRIASTFVQVWGERNFSPININGKSGNNISKLDGMWAIVTYINDEIYYYKEFETQYEACIAYFNWLDPDNAHYCKMVFDELINDKSKTLPKPKYVKYEDLSENEKVILDVCLKLLDDSGDLYTHVVYPEREDEVDRFVERIQFYKKGNVWVSYILERNEIGGYREYYTLYSLCIDMFEALEKSHTDYCLSNFPIMVQKALENHHIRRK